jgi:hypothetical protein
MRFLELGWYFRSLTARRCIAVDCGNFSRKCPLPKAPGRNRRKHHGALYPRQISPWLNRAVSRQLLCDTSRSPVSAAPVARRTRSIMHRRAIRRDNHAYA